ncbi:MAG: patatin-like phospholipase family protein [Flavobacteriaceae bacterium]
MKYKIGLTLSGGGSKGLVHAGMIQYFEENNIKPGIISGTSTGSIAGALYAAGYKSHEIANFYKSEKPFSRKYLSGRLGLMNTPKILEIFNKYLDQRTFEDLEIPLRIVASNLFTGQETIFDSGPLAPAVLASSSYPGVFKPMIINDIYYTDGGILNHFPADIIRNDCEFLIGMHLSPNKIIDKTKLTVATDVLKRVIDIGGSQWENEKLKICDLGLQPQELAKFSSFNTDPINLDKLYKIGYNSIKEAYESLKSVHKKTLD